MENKRKAGGKNTNKNGLGFEDITDIYEFLLKQKQFTIKILEKKEYLYKDENNSKIFWFTKKSKSLFKKISKKELNIENIRNPDESIIIDNDKIDIFIIEKKSQNVDGSVETKLWASPTLKEEYEFISKNKINIHYILTINKWLYTKFESNEIKWLFLRKKLKENNIFVFDGNDENYFENIFNHIFK